MDKRRILVIEDESLVAEEIRVALKNFGYEIVGVARTGKEALNLANEFSPDLALVDIKLRGDMDGIETAEKLRSQFGIPIVYLTVLVDQDTLDRIKQTQPFGFIVKPFEERELRGVIETALYKSKMETKIRESEQKYKETSDFLESLFNAIPDMIGILDKQYNVLRYNKAGYEFLNLKPDQVHGKKCYQLIGRKTPCKMCVISECIKKGKPAYIEKYVDELGVWLDARAYPLMDEDGSVVRVIEHLRDITELKEAEEKLRLLSVAIEQSTEGIAVYDLKGNLLFANKTFAGMHGYTIDEIIGRNYSMFYTPEQMESVSDADRKVKKDGKFRGEIRHLRKNGTTFPAEMSSSLILDDSGTPVGILGTVRDITEKKRAESRIRESQEKYRSLMDSMDDPVYLMNKEMKYLYASSKLLSRYGLKEVDVLGRKYSEFHSKEKTREFSRELNKVFRTGKSVVYKHESERDGRHFIRTLSPIRNSKSGKVDAVTVVSKDITEWVKKEQEVKESEASLSAVLDNTDDLIVSFDRKGRIVKYNESYAAVMKELYNIEVKQGMRLIEFIPENERQLWIKKSRRVFRGQRFIEEVRYKIKDKIERVYEVSFNPIRIEDRIVGSSQFARDITERKRVERIQNVLLKISNAIGLTQNIDELFVSIREYLGELIDTTNFMMALYDQEKDELSSIYKVDQKDKYKTFPLGKTLTAYVIRNAKPLLIDWDGVKRLERLGKVKTVGTPSKIWLGVPLKMGTRVIGVMSVQSYDDPEAYTQKDVELMEIVSNHIAFAVEKRLIQDRLKESEEKYRTVVEQSHDAIYIYWKDRFKFVNDRVCEITEYSKEELYSMNVWDVVHPDDREKIKEIGRRRQMGEDVPNTYEARIITKSGKTKHLEFAISMIPYGGAKAILGNVRDITERKKAEKELLLSEESYRSIFDNASDAIYIQDRDGRFLDVNRGAVEMYGYPKEFFIGKTPEAVSAPGKNDMKKIAGYIKSAFEGKPQRFEFWGRRKNGEVFPKIVRLNKGVYLGQEVVVAFAIDITERRMVEDAIRDSEQLFRSVADHSHDGILIIGEDYRFQYVNDELCRILAYPRKEVLGKDFRIFLDDESRELVADRYVRRQRGEKIPSRYEFNVVRKSGEKRRVEISSTVMEDSKGRKKTVAQLLDITEKKRAERELRHRIEMEMLLSSISTKFIGLSHKEVDRGINWALKRIGLFVGVDEIYLLRFSDDGKSIENIYEWNDSGTESIKSIINGGSLDQYRWFKDKIKSFEMIHIADIEDLPPEAVNERKIIRQLSVKSFIVVPLVYEESVIGVLGLNSVREQKKWSREDNVIIRAFGDMFTTTLIRKRAEEQIEKDLKEKELLLKEIHHRVKNNMQIISSLLSLQSRYIKDKDALEMIEDSRNRVRSMALVHERLYRRGDFSSIDVTGYIDSLVRELFKNYHIDTGKIKFEIDVEDVKLDIDRAIPCGLVVNELVSNALKHAFPKGWKRKGEVLVKFYRKKSSEYELVVRDNGKGMPEGFDIEGSDSLGLHLVHIITEDQLDGRIEVNVKDGTEFKIQFGRRKKGV